MFDKPAKVAEAKSLLKVASRAEERQEAFFDVEIHGFFDREEDANAFMALMRSLGFLACRPVLLASSALSVY